MIYVGACCHSTCLEVRGQLYLYVGFRIKLRSPAWHGKHLYLKAVSLATSTLFYETRSLTEPGPVSLC